jgi:hypothetical protein
MSGFSELLLYRPHGSAGFSASGNFVVPSNVTLLKVCCIGGGGAGGYYQYLIAGNGGATSFGSYVYAPGGCGGKGGGDKSYSGYAGASGGDCSVNWTRISNWNNYAGSSAPYRSNYETAGKLWNFSTSSWEDTEWGKSGQGYNARDGSGASGSSCSVWLYGIPPGTVIPVTVGAGGSQIGGSSGRIGSAGRQGVVFVYW